MGLGPGKRHFSRYCLKKLTGSHGIPGGPTKPKNELGLIYRSLDRRPQLRQRCSAVPVVPAAGVFRRIERARRAWFAPADFRRARAPAPPPNLDATRDTSASDPGNQSGRYSRRYCIAGVGSRNY